MDNHRPDAMRTPLADSPTVFPLLAARIAKDMAPILERLRVRDGRVQVPVEHGQRIAYVIARRTGSSAVFPDRFLRIVDAEVHVPVVAVRTVSASGRLEREVDSPSVRRIVLRDDIADHIVDFFFGVDPSGKRKVQSPQLQFAMGRDLDIIATSVKRAVVQLHTVIDSVQRVARMVLAVTLQGPVANQAGIGGCRRRRLWVWLRDRDGSRRLFRVEFLQQRAQPCEYIGRAILNCQTSRRRFLDEVDTQHGGAAQLFDQLRFAFDVLAGLGQLRIDLVVRGSAGPQDHAKRGLQLRIIGFLRVSRAGPRGHRLRSRSNGRNRRHQPRGGIRLIDRQRG